MAKGTPLYAMTGRELRAAMERAEEDGNAQRAQACREQLELNARIAEAFRAKCSAEPQGEKP